MNKNPFPDEIYLKRTKPLPPDIRGEYFRDQTKIIHSQPFRRLKSKTQVFTSPDNDHICTRIEHVLHVATIAASVCKGFNQCGSWRLNEELAYAIGLAHDLGHAPFGHEGERALSAKITPQRFMHEINGYRIVERLSNYGDGLNLTYAVKDGLICHCGEDFNNNALRPAAAPNDLDNIKDRSHMPTTYEGCVVRLADKIAYLGRDIEDAVREKIITPADVPAAVKKELGGNNGEIINALVLDLINNSKDSGSIGFSKEKFEIINELKSFNYKYIYNHPSIARLKGILHKALSGLFDYYKDLFDKYGLSGGYTRESKNTALAFWHYLEAMKRVYKEDTPAQTIITDYIAGMTDFYASACIKEAVGINLDFNYRPACRDF
jgi:dGTPase